MEVFVFDWWWRSHQSSAHKGLRILRFCIVSWKDERDLPIKHCMGRQIGMVQKFTEYRALDTVDGWPIEFEWNIFPGFTTLQLSHKVQELLLRLGETPENFYRTDHLHVDVQRHLMGIKGQQERMRVKCSTRFSLCKNSEQDSGDSTGLDQRKIGILSMKIVHKENGTKWQKRWWCHAQKADTQPSEPRVHCPEECLKAKVVENCQYTIVPTRKRLKRDAAKGLHQLYHLLHHEARWKPDMKVKYLWASGLSSSQERGDKFMNKREACSPPHTIHKRKQSQRVINDLDNVDFIPSNVHSSRKEGFVVYLWRQWSCNQDDLKGRSPTMRTFFQNPQSCSWLVIRSNQFGSKNPNSNTSTPRTNSLTCSPKGLSRVMSGTIFFVC